MENLMRIMLVYSVERLSDNSWIFLNRHYKPIGFIPYGVGQHRGGNVYDQKHYDVDYCKHLHRYKLPRLTFEAIKKNFFYNDYPGVTELKHIHAFWLFRDNCRPWDSNIDWQFYCQKLRKLLSYSVMLVDTEADEYYRNLSIKLLQKEEKICK